MGSESFARITTAFLLSMFAVLLAPLAARSETCVGCHDGSDPNAPDVYRYWDGSWWDSTYPTDPPDTLIQQGGHGDPDGQAALTCEGATGCHDLTQAATHGNGILETVGNRSGNTALLRAEFLAGDSTPSHDFALTFNTFCATACHTTAQVGLCAKGDGSRTIPYTTQLGNAGTLADGDGSAGPRKVKYWLDTDISTAATLDEDDFVVCVSCHNPHGTGAAKRAEHQSNFMFQDSLVDSQLCRQCHADIDPPPAVPSPVQAVDLLCRDGVTVSWAEVAGATGYRVYRAASEEGPFDLVATPGTGLASFDDPAGEGQGSFYRVTAYNMGLQSDPSAPQAAVSRSCSLGPILFLLE